MMNNCAPPPQPVASEKPNADGLPPALVPCSLRPVQLVTRRYHLRLAHPWKIARSHADPAADPATSTSLILKLQSPDGLTGLGESVPSRRYHETPQSVAHFLSQVDPERLSFADVTGSMAYLDSVAPGNPSAKAALNIALLDGAARRSHQPVHRYLGLGFTEGRHLTSYSIGLDAPAAIRRKVALAAPFPILKLKVGSAHDRENLAALRDAAPDKPIRVDANEAWTTPEEALRHIEWLAADGQVQFVEQPMPASTPPADQAWLRTRSPLPIMADESCLTTADVPRCVEGFHAVNVKLGKSCGISGAAALLQAARAAGLKTMIGCMIETSILATAGAHLASLADYLDLDGHLLITNDPYRGATADAGVVSLASAPDPIGLQVTPRAEPQPVAATPEERGRLE